MTEENGNQKNLSEWVEKRSRQITGRRQADAHKCAMHDYLFGKQDDCISMIKETIKAEVKKGEHRWELLDAKLERYITKWAFAIIGSVVSFLTVIIIGLAGWQFVSLRDDVREITKIMSVMNQTSVESLAVLKLKQDYVIKFIEGLEPEHQELMDFLRHQEEKAEKRRNGSK